MSEDLRNAPAATPSLSVIIPFFDDPALPHLRERLANLCRELETREDIEVLVVEEKLPGATLTSQSHGWGWPKIRYVEYLNTTGVFSIGNARNVGAQHARGATIAFCDIDLRVPRDFWDRLLQYCAVTGIGQYKKRYFCVPCLYLTELGTTEYLSAPSDARTLDFLLRWLHGDTTSVEILAPCTSFIVVDRLHFLSEGGYCPDFVGHGFEDFELHHRLVSGTAVFARPDDYYHNYHDWTQSHYRGFRSLFSLIGRGALYAHIIAVHLWHPRPPQMPFYLANRDNESRLPGAMKAFDTTGRRPPPLVAQEARKATFMFLGQPHSRSAQTLRDVFPLLGTPLYTDENTWMGDAGKLDVRKFERDLSRNRVTRILFPNPYRTPARLGVYRWCREKAFPYLVFERGGLPHSWFFDPCGFNADSSSYSRMNWDRDLTHAEEEQARNYISWSLAGHETLERQGDRIGAEALAARLGTTGKKVLFVPLQRPSDTVAVHLAGGAVSVTRFIAFIDQCAEALRGDGWAVVCKRHPYETSAPPLHSALYAEPDTHILDLVSMADSVALMNSSVGLYAMMMDTPCYVFADAFFAFEGINQSLPTLDLYDVTSRIRAGMSIDTTAVYRFIHYLTREFYSFGRAEYRTWQEQDGNLRKAATSIDFNELRIPGMAHRVYKADALRMVPRDAPLYERFGLS